MFRVTFKIIKENQSLWLGFVLFEDEIKLENNEQWYIFENVL